MNCLILVDIQNDFVPGGSLAVKEGDQIIPLVNRLMESFDLILATQDWHPADHKSFAANHPEGQIGQQIELDGLPQVLWPVHCVQESFGAELVAGLHTSHIQHIFHKGTDMDIDSYSGFFDNGQRKSTGLGNFLKEKQVEQVYIVGLATDYCVKATALDAQNLGFRTYVIEDACRGVNLQEGDVSKALNEMQQAGISLIQSQDLLR
ncbi:MAG: bifunctional nicotinamidase/pyrazinamidase [Bacteroidota bacterium]